MLRIANVAREKDVFGVPPAFAFRDMTPWIEPAAERMAHAGILPGSCALTSDSVTGCDIRRRETVASCDIFQRAARAVCVTAVGLPSPASATTRGCRVASLDAAKAIEKCTRVFEHVYESTAG